MCFLIKTKWRLQVIDGWFKLFRQESRLINLIFFSVTLKNSLKAFCRMFQTISLTTSNKLLHLFQKQFTIFCKGYVTDGFVQICFPLI